MKALAPTILVTIALLASRSTSANECEAPLAVESPCAGVLLPSSAAEEGLKCLLVDVPKLQLDMRFLQDERESFEKYHKKLMQIESSRNMALESQIEFLLKTNTEPKWYESPAFHFAIGFVTASAATIGITYAVNDN
jgi:hypothetical protein